MRASSSRRVAIAFLFAAAFAVVVIVSGVSAGCPFLEMQGE